MMVLTCTERSTRRICSTMFSSRFGFTVIGFFIGFLLSSFLSMTFTVTNIPWTSSSFLPYVHNSNPSRCDTTRNLISTEELYSADFAEDDDDDTIGWNMIHVFVGTNESKIEHMIDASTIPRDYFHATKWFSQLRQDEVVFQLLRKKRNGYFIDLAANDAIRISNTFALEYFHGWNGIVIEPNPIYWPGLAYRNCTVVAAVVGQETGAQMKFKFPNKSKPPPKGGLVGPSFDNNEDSSSGEDELRFTITLSDIFRKFNTPSVIDYFSLDIEGAETFVMESFPFDQYRFNVLTVERADERLCTLLRDNGYIQMKSLKKWGETLWIHTSIIHDSTLIDPTALDIDTENYKYRERVVLSSQAHHDSSIA